MRALFVTIVIGASLSAVPLEARAGACFECATNEECVAITANPRALCVQWNDDFGCGAQRLSCCPGQGCNIEQDDSPSCEPADCTRVGAAPGGDASVAPDVGGGDSGGAQPAPDAAPAGDGGMGGNADAAGRLDAATSTHADASTVGRLGGGNAERSSSCSAVSPEDAPGAALLLLVAGALVAARRRR